RRQALDEPAASRLCRSVLDAWPGIDGRISRRCGQSTELGRVTVARTTNSSSTHSMRVRRGCPSGWYWISGDAFAAARSCGAVPGTKCVSIAAVLATLVTASVRADEPPGQPAPP